MCVLFLHYHPPGQSSQCTCPYILVAADNRDEFLDRPTKPLAFWGQDDSILAGRDTQSANESEQGTWMGVSRGGKFAVLTNYRSHTKSKPNCRSRGLIVSDFLSGEVSTQEYCNSLFKEKDKYNGFSTIVADLNSEEGDMMYCSNRGGDNNEGIIRTLEAGHYGLGNSMLDSPWRKVQKGKAGLEKIVEGIKDCGSEDYLTESLLNLLADDSCLHPDPNISATVFPKESLQHLSSIFVQPVMVHGRPCATKSSSVVLVDKSGKVTFTERTISFPQLSPGCQKWTAQQHSFTISVPTST